MPNRAAAAAIFHTGRRDAEFVQISNFEGEKNMLAHAYAQPKHSVRTNLLVGPEPPPKVQRLGVLKPSMPLRRELLGWCFYRSGRSGGMAVAPARL